MMYHSKNKNNTKPNKTKTKTKKHISRSFFRDFITSLLTPERPLSFVVYFEEWQIISTKINPEGVACYAGLLQGRFDMKRATSLFDSFCSNVVRHVVCFCWPFCRNFRYQAHIFCISKIWVLLRIWSAKTQLNQNITSTKKHLNKRVSLAYLSSEILLHSVVYVKERQIKLTQKTLLVSI